MPPQRQNSRQVRGVIQVRPAADVQSDDSWEDVETTEADETDGATTSTTSAANDSRETTAERSESTKITNLFLASEFNGSVERSEKTNHEDDLLGDSIDIRPRKPKPKVNVKQKLKVIGRKMGNASKQVKRTLNPRAKKDNVKTIFISAPDSSNCWTKTEEELLGNSNDSLVVTSRTRKQVPVYAIPIQREHVNMLVVDDAEFDELT